MDIYSLVHWYLEDIFYLWGIPGSLTCWPSNERNLASGYLIQASTPIKAWRSPELDMTKSTDQLLSNPSQRVLRVLPCSVHSSMTSLNLRAFSRQATVPWSARRPSRSQSAFAADQSKADMAASWTGRRRWTSLTGGGGAISRARSDVGVGRRNRRTNPIGHRWYFSLEDHCHLQEVLVSGVVGHAR